ncbi:MAG: isoleucine--tRNA ligase, partial [Clostridia bacterium]|nr:isoleucine--tRNA ligase [Clostridia bacterium]
YIIEELDVTLLQEDLQIFPQSEEGYVAAEDKGITVALNCELTDELLEEGAERELVSKIQNMRKEAGFEVTDRIEIYYTADGKMTSAVLKKAGFAGDVLAEKVTAGTAQGFTKEQNINGEKVTLTLIKK